MDESMNNQSSIDTDEASSEIDPKTDEDKGNNPFTAADGDYKFCTRCGRRLAADAAYCDGCGHMQGTKKPAPEFAASYKRKKSYRPEKINDIVDKERKYYSEKFAAINETESPVCWNWYACTGWLWYAYRKMPIEAIVFFAAYFILGLIPVIGRLFKIGMLIANGAFGNFIYLKHIEHTIDRIEALPVGMRQNAVNEYRGVSGLMLVAAFMISGIVLSGVGLFRLILTSRIIPLWYIREIF